MIGILLRYLPWLAKTAPFFAFLKGRAKLIGLILSAASLLGIYLHTQSLQNKVELLETQSALYSGQLLQCQTTNASNQNAILELRSANTQLAAAIEISEDKRWAAIQEAIRRDKMADQAIRETLTELERLRNADPTCEELANIDMGVACPLVIERLRQHAAGTIGRD